LSGAADATEIRPEGKSRIEFQIAIRDHQAFLMGVFMRWPIWFVAISLSLAVAAGAAKADDFTDCFSVGSKSYANPAFYQTGLDACTRLIGVRSGKRKAEAYSSRASWLHKLGKEDAALADYDRAL
jgi:hypothetical protein